MNWSLPDRSPGIGDMGNEKKSGLVRQTLCGRPAERLCFYWRPLSAFPLFDRLVVALDRTPFGLLMPPLQTMHQPPHVIGVIVDPELLVDEPGDARRCPQVRVVAASPRPFEQQLDQALQLFRPQLRRSPGEKRTRNACSPPRRRAWYQRMTELAPQPKRRAASLNEQPESTKAKARRRRSSSRSPLPFGLGIGVQAEKQSTYIIGFFLEESYYILYTWLNR